MQCCRHPDTEAAATCEVCEQPICSFCRVKRTDRVLCYPCDLDQEPPPPGAGVEIDTEDPVSRLVGDAANPGPSGAFLRYVIAVMLGGGVAVVVALLWSKVAAGMGRDLLYFPILAGGLVGVTVRLAGGYQRLLLLPPIAGGLTLFCFFLERASLIHDLLRQDRSMARAMDRVPLAFQVGPLLDAAWKGMDWKDWGFSLAGVGAACLVAGLVPVAIAPQPRAIKIDERQPDQPTGE